MRKYVLMLPILLAALLLQAAQLNVVGEVFSTVCDGCGGDYSVARSALIQLSQEYPFIIPVIWNMTDETSPGSVDRFEWYESTEDPYSAWGGSLFYGGDYDVINTFYDYYMELVGVQPPMKISSQMTVSGGRDTSVLIDSDVELYEDIIASDVRIFFLLTYHDLTNYHGVVLDKSEESELLSYTGGSVTNYVYEFPVLDEWELDRLRGVVIVQDWNSKEILQASQAEIVLANDEEDVVPPSAMDVRVYPNPFNPETNISFNVTELDRNKEVTVDVFNIRGQKVRSLYRGIPTSETTTLSWNGTDENGRNVGSGVYYAVVLVPGRSTNVKKMILLK